MLDTLIHLALQEDVFSGDITSEALFQGQDVIKEAFVIAKIPGVLAGVGIAEKVFHKVDPALSFEVLTPEGQPLTDGQKIAKVSGSLRSILVAERIALNFLQHLSGVATQTRLFVTAVAGTRAKIMDTRKTLPGYRELQKYAVKIGGGKNHRQGLYDQYLIKDNHLMGRTITEALMLIQKHNKDRKQVEIEVDRLDQIDEVLKGGADIILLDNFSPEDLAQAVTHIAGRALTEASGGITLQNVRAYAETGVDRISIGALTHSVPALDIGLDIECP